MKNNIIIKKYFSIIFLILILNLIPNCSAQESCLITKNNTPGICQSIRECNSVLQDIKAGVRDYTSCPNKGRIIYVCCPVPEEIKPTTTYATELTKNFGTFLEPRKSDIKCQEYAQAVFETTKSISLVPGAPSLPIKLDTCGFKSLPLIVGGTLAAPREFPHMALIGFNVEDEINWACGGTLISERYVLTAAHCLISQLGKPTLVRLGDLDIRSNLDDSDPEDFNITDEIPHPNFKRSSRYHDIALLKLDRDVKLNSYKRPACLPIDHDNATPKVIATGWGKTEWAGKGSEHLQKVILNKFEESECNEIYSQQKSRKLRNGIQYSIQICTGSNDGNKDTCQGDSGGPIQVYHRSEYCMYEIIGITSFGITCGTLGIPGVYTRVFPYVDWIENIIWRLRCIIEETNTPGECKAATKCPIVYDILTRGLKNYTRCSGTWKLVVCCPLIETSTSALTETLETRTEKLHEIKCREYQQYVYGLPSSLPLIHVKNINPVDKCGFKNLELISNGIDAKPKEFPHMAALGYKGTTKVEFRCGGSLISERFILTAAHCMKKSKPHIVRLGDLNIRSDYDVSSPIDVAVEEIITHPDYDANKKKNDIALIKMAHDITFDEYKRPACLASENDWNGINAVITGWGNTDSYDVEGKDHLQKARIQKFKENDCQQIFGKVRSRNAAPTISYSTQVCAGSKTNTTDACLGDSGGPLQVLNNREYCMWDIVGITSFGPSQSCGIVGVPGVYTRVYPYISWIENIIWT